MTAANNPLGEDALAFRDAFRAALCNASRTTMHRYEKAGTVPPPDAWIGGRPAWRISTIRRTVDRLTKAGPGPIKAMPKGGKRKVKEETSQ